MTARNNIQVTGLMLFWVLIVFLMPVKNGFANPEPELIKQANLEYSSGFYDHALELYLSVSEAGYVSHELYYNLGNTYFKLNRIPEAILNYERALKLAPGDENTQFNLELARVRTIDKIDSIPELFYERWFRLLVNSYHADAWGTISIVLLFLALILAVVFLISVRRWLRIFSFYLTALLLVISLSTLALAYVQKHQATGKPEAIIFDPSVTVKSSPSDTSIDLFVIHEGTKVNITDQIGEWYEVRIASGSMGWLKMDSVEVI